MTVTTLLKPDKPATKRPALRKATSAQHIFVARGCEADFYGAATTPNQRKAEQIRWATSFLIVIGVLSAATLWWLYTPTTASSSPSPPAAAMVVELAPLPVSPSTKIDQPPGPEQAEVAPPPAQKKPEPEPEPDIPPLPTVEKTEMAVKPKPEKVEEKPAPKTVEKKEKEEENTETDEPPSTASAPPDTQIQEDKAAAPNLGLTESLEQANRAPRWRDALLHTLNKEKRYPYKARRMRQEGVAHLHFIMNREGEVLSANVTHSSGHSILDKETLELIKRAQPLPKPPESVTGETLEFVVPVEFFLNR